MTADLVDAHCHLGDAAFDADRDAVIERARARGVTHALVVGQNPEENLRVLELAGVGDGNVDRFDGFLRPACGQHPDQPDEVAAARSLEIARRHAPRLAGLGEVGLDRFKVKDEAGRAAQLRIFEAFISLSLETGLGLSVHSRSAGHYAVDALIANGRPKAVLHAFDGKHTYATRGYEAGFRFSIPPSIVRSKQKQDLVRAIPLDALLLESDAPVLGPDREARNEPQNIVLALEMIAEIKGVDRSEVAAVTTRNARGMFRL